MLTLLSFINVITSKISGYLRYFFFLKKKMIFPIDMYQECLLVPNASYRVISEECGNGWMIDIVGL